MVALFVLITGIGSGFTLGCVYTHRKWSKQYRERIAVLHEEIERLKKATNSLEAAKDKVAKLEASLLQAADTILKGES